MHRGPRFRLALISAILLGHLGLPAAHLAAVTAGEHAVTSIGPATPALVTSAAPTRLGGGHDPSLCPICLASSQARAGILRTAAAGDRPGAPAPLPARHDPALVLPRAPDPGPASPRAPPVRALAFA